MANGSWNSPIYISDDEDEKDVAGQLVYVETDSSSAQTSAFYFPFSDLLALPSGPRAMTFGNAKAKPKHQPGFASSLSQTVWPKQSVKTYGVLAFMKGWLGLAVGLAGISKSRLSVPKHHNFFHPFGQ